MANGSRRFHLTTHFDHPGRLLVPITDHGYVGFMPYARYTWARVGFNLDSINDKLACEVAVQAREAHDKLLNETVIVTKPLLDLIELCITYPTSRVYVE